MIKGFMYIAFPIIIVSTVAIRMLEMFGLLSLAESALYPVTVLWLGLPAITGILLIFGILRKELTLVMLASLFATTNFASVLTPIQMIVFSIVTMLYIPCAATIAVLVKELGWRKGAIITIFEILFAVLVGGVAYRILLYFVL
jgi:ferrous iron transport protein B